MFRKLTVTAIGVSLVGVTLGSFMADTSAPPPDAAVSTNCTFSPASAKSAREMWHQVSRDAELVAPGRLRQGADATSTSRRRSAVQKPQPIDLKNFVDAEIFGKMTRDNIKWTSPASDEEFLRRVTLDLTGQVPTSDKVKSFLADTSAGKRDRLIDELLASEEWVERWTLWFGDLVQNVQRSDNIIVGGLGRNAFYMWMRDSLRTGKPYDQMVREIIIARGPANTTGPVNYWIRQIQTNGPVQDTFDNLSSRTGEMFLGLPLECISCHSGPGHLEAVNSSLSRRTRTDFWKNASFFASDTARIQRNADNSQEYVVDANPGGESRAQYFLNTTSGNKTARQPGSDGLITVQPAFFLSGEQPRSGEPRREAYARILTAQPQFARATVNYVWKELFTIGIVEPADSFDLVRQDAATLAPGATLQPTHPELLTKLADSFVASGYSLKSLMKTIVSSESYQLSSFYTPGPWNEQWTPYYARHYPRRLIAESVLDAIARVTNVPVTYQVPLLTIDHAMQLPDPTDPQRGNFLNMLNAFGRGDRDSTPRTRDGSIVQALEMLNDSFVTTRVKSASNSTVMKLLGSTKDPGTIVDELYITTLGRRPSSAERNAAITYLRSGELTRKTEDLQFVLINRLQFLYN